MISGETLSLWRIFCSWWYTTMIKPIDLVLNSRCVAGFHLTHVKTRLNDRYRDALIHLLKLYRQNVIRPRIDTTWTFHQVAYYKNNFCSKNTKSIFVAHLMQVIEASKRLSERKNIGKVILTPY